MRRDNDAETSKQEMTETIVSIRRVAKTVKGGRNKIGRASCRERV